MQLKIKRLHPQARLPEYAHPGDAGLDLFSVEAHRLNPGDAQLIKTGIALELPHGYEAQVRPRSGLALKHSITVLNTPGTVDAGYRGEIGVVLINHGREPFEVTSGMKIAQMVINQIVIAEISEVESLSDSSRGAGGYGSTGV